MVSIKTIAEEAGVSVGTVSNVINNKGNVSEKNRERVLESIKKNGYIPDESARSLRLGREKYRKKISTKGCVGFVINDTTAKGFHDGFFAKMLNGVLTECQRDGIKILTELVKEDYDETRDTPRMVRQMQIDGLIIAVGNNEGFMLHMSKLNIPGVLIESYFKGGNLNSVYGDNYNGGRLAAEHLVKMGHREIAFLHHANRNRSIVERFRAFREVLDASHIPFNEELIENTNLSYESGAAAMKRLLDSGKKFTAVFAGNDNSALGAKSAIEQSGRRVPDDISIIGYDNIYAASEVMPPLTTIDPQVEEMGRLAVRRIFEIINTQMNSPMYMMLPASLVERGTVRKI